MCKKFYGKQNKQLECRDIDMKKFRINTILNDNPTLTQSIGIPKYDNERLIFVTQPIRMSSYGIRINWYIYTNRRIAFVY